MNSLLIAIDGPSGSGKSSTARGVATRLGLAYLDTGSMYRAAAWAWLASGIPAGQDERITAHVRGLRLDVGTSPENPTIGVDGRDVTAEIREPRIAQHVSTVATIPAVRAHLTDQMRAIIAERQRRIVVEGRDITTVVAPDADVRVLLVADPAARVARREAELSGVTRREVVDQVVRRDRDDATVSEFEKPAPGVTMVDTTHDDLATVIERVCALVPSELVGE